jgi:hypothetical protein
MRNAPEGTARTEESLEFQMMNQPWISALDEGPGVYKGIDAVMAARSEFYYERHPP